MQNTLRSFGACAPEIVGCGFNYNEDYYMIPSP